MMEPEYIKHLMEVADRDEGSGPYFKDGVQVRLRQHEKDQLAEWRLIGRKELLSQGCDSCGGPASIVSGGIWCRPCLYKSGAVKVRHCFEPVLAGWEVDELDLGEMSQAGLAAAIGVQQPFISRIVRNGGRVTVVVGHCLREVLGPKSVRPIFVFTVNASALRDSLANISQRDFARRSQISRSHLAKMLSGDVIHIQQSTYDNLYERE